MVKDDYDEVAVSIVCDERVPMKLTGADRVEAIRRLTLLGIEALEILHLLKWEVSQEVVYQFRRRHGIPLPPSTSSAIPYPRCRYRTTS